MESYKRGSHTVWDCKYHLVWVTKYRYQVLGGDVGNVIAHVVGKKLLRWLAVCESSYGWPSEPDTV